VLHLPRPTSLDVTVSYYLTGLAEFPPPDRSDHGPHSLIDAVTSRACEESKG
jgi:hypothetical protein